MYKIVYSGKAANEADDALNWYEVQQAGLGERFVLEYSSVSTLLKSILIGRLLIRMNTGSFI